MFYMGQFTHILLMFAFFHANVDKDVESAKDVLGLLLLGVWLTEPLNLRLKYLTTLEG